jgi:Mn-dependent DtxR family transcriptional regulator
MEEESEETKEMRKRGYVKKVNKKNVWFTERNKI